MTYLQLAQLVQKGEGLFVEFKKRIQFPEKVAREVVAFCNTKGGNLLIGVNDDGVISGLKNHEEELHQFYTLIKKNIRFEIDYTIEVITIPNGKSVIWIKINESILKPNYVLDPTESKNGIVYVRDNDKSIKASVEMVNYLKVKSRDKSKALQLSPTHTKILQLFESFDFLTISQIKNQLMINMKEISFKTVELASHGLIRIQPIEGEEDKLYQIIN